MATVLPRPAPASVEPVLKRDLFIDNAWRPATGGKTFTLTNPATEENFGQIADATEADVDAAVMAARKAFDTGPWPRMAMRERADTLLRFANALEADIEVLARLTTIEGGLPRADSIGGIKAMLIVLRYYAEIANTIELVEIRKGRTGVTARIEKHPVGVVAAIVPWNSPIVMAAFNLPSALVSGCTVVLKPSELTPLSAGYLADAALAAGLPPGVLNVLTGGAQASEALVRHAGIDKIAFTGSTATGRKIAEAAAPTLKHVTLKLGGKAAAIVLDDAPLDRLVETMTPAIMFNNGQMCLQPSRLLVPEHRKDEIVAAFIDAFRQVRVGAPTDPETQVGPLISRKQQERVLGLLQSAIDEGGRLALGGGRPEGLDTGFYVAPAIITDVAPEARVAVEEIFAPVLVVLTYRDEEEALRIASSSEFGLSAAVYSADTERALAIAQRLHSGSININNGQYLDVGIPFGGVKQSGYGQELGPEGLAEYYETRVIYLDADPFHGLG
jgi:aldehyde dehydrogenase (NAD+)